MEEDKALIVHEGQHLMPIFTIDQAVYRHHMVVDFVKQVMVKDVDYGKVPGTDKDVLLKAGAERLCTFFGLSPRFVPVEKIEDWSGQDHGGEPFFYYWFKCQLYRGEQFIAEADGSCNSWESKYRYRKADRLCPKCGQPVRKSKKQGGGWYCWARMGGCGATFPDGDQAIEGQQVGRIPNPDPADIVNTVKKMSQKRALVAAVLIGVNASQFFTQDVDEMDGNIIEGQIVQPAPAAPHGDNGGPTWTPELAPEDTDTEPPVVEPAKPKQRLADVEPSIRNEWRAAALALAEMFPAVYEDDDGKPNYFRMRGALAKHGVLTVRADNLEAAVDILRSHANDKLAESVTEALPGLAL